MTRYNDEDFVLGENVTEQAKARGKGGSYVLSIRLPIEEFAAIEDASRQAGKTVSQIVREAVRTCLSMKQAEGASVTISVEGQSTSSFGAAGVFTKASHAQTLTSPLVTV